MRIPVVQGIIRRRLLVNFAADPSTVARLLPLPLRPKLARDCAVVGICLIRLEQVRPLGLPALLGVSSENAAHRIAVAWTEGGGREREGVYIPRRDTDSMLNHLIGGRVFPGEHHRAKFDISDEGGHIDLRMVADDAGAAVHVRGREAPVLQSSLFPSLEAASGFFQGGSLGYSARRDLNRLDGLTLHTKQWKVSPLEVTEVHSSFFDEPGRFPPGSIKFDCALLMRDIEHEWHSEPDLEVSKLAAVG